MFFSIVCLHIFRRLYFCCCHNSIHFCNFRFGSRTTAHGSISKKSMCREICCRFWCTKPSAYSPCTHTQKIELQLFHVSTKETIYICHFHVAAFIICSKQSLLLYVSQEFSDDCCCCCCCCSISFNRKNCNETIIQCHQREKHNFKIVQAK